MLRRFAEIVAPSAFLANEMRKHGFDSTIIPNAVDLDAYPYKLRQKVAPRFVWMRSFHSIYDPEMALKAFAIIHATHPNATMVMAGVDKGLEGTIRLMARDMGLQHAVRFPGYLDQEQKVSEFARGDIFLNSTRIDNTPVSVIEACAMGLPVIATRVGGLPDMITDVENGLLVASENISEMTNAMIRLLDDPALAEKLSRNGRLLAERSAWPAVRRSWDSVFTAVLTRDRQRGRIPRYDLNHQIDQ